MKDHDPGQDAYDAAEGRAYVMKVERSGQLNEKPIMEDVEAELRKMWDTGEYTAIKSYAVIMLTAYRRVFAKRGMLTDIGLEQLKDFK